MSQPPGAVRVKEEDVEGEFVCLVRPRRGLAPMARVKKEEDQEGLVQLAVPPEPAIEPPVLYPSVDELPFWLGNNGGSEDEDDSTSDQSTLHREMPEPRPTATSVPTDHQPAAASRISLPRHSPSRNRNQCSVCGKAFPSPSHLRIHHRVHTGERPFECTFPGCTKAFTQKGTLTNHEHKHSNTRPIRCNWPGCKKAFTDSNNLTVHTRRHTGDRPYRCTWSGCDKAFVQRHHLTDHLNTHTGSRPHRCPHCPSAFTDRPNLIRHLRLHSGQLPYQCGLCYKRFNRKFQLTGHMRNKHRNCTETPNARPQVDSTALQSSQTLPTAVQQDVEQPPASTSAAPHPSTRPRRHQCPQCGKSFTSPSKLLIHSRVHTHERPLVCTALGCTKAFKRKGDLTKHLRLHSNLLPFKCTWPGCTKAFNSSSDLKVHLNTHTGARPHCCPHCPLAFKQRSHLTAHLRLHTGQLPYQCGLCSKRFNQKHQLTSHMHTNHRDYPQFPNRPPADSTVPQSTATSTTSHHPPSVPLSFESADHHLASAQVETEVKDPIKPEPSCSYDTNPPLPLHPIKYELVVMEEEEECECSECLANLDSRSIPH